MNDNLIEQAEKLLDGITPGPWEQRIGPADETHSEYFDGTLIGSGEPLHLVIAPSTVDEFAYIVPAITGDGPTSSRNAEFIAAAPTLVADLLAEVKRLRDVMDELTDVLFVPTDEIVDAVRRRLTPHVPEGGE